MKRTNSFLILLLPVIAFILLFVKNGPVQHPLSTAGKSAYVNLSGNKAHPCNQWNKNMPYYRGRTYTIAVDWYYSYSDVSVAGPRVGTTDNSYFFTGTASQSQIDSFIGTAPSYSDDAHPATVDVTFSIPLDAPTGDYYADAYLEYRPYGQSPDNSWIAFYRTPLVISPGVPGCTDPSATNYNPSANSDDGSCLYSLPPPGPSPPVCNA